MRFQLIAFWFFCSCSAIAQDTLFFYFDINSSIISDHDQSGLRNLATQYDAASVDSVLFVGYADSIGNMRSNLRLSERRAEHTYKMCRNFLTDEIPYRILAKGENVRPENWQSRRVEMIIYHEPTLVNEEEKEEIKEADPRCFKVDFEALEYCHIREIKKGKQKYVQIEAINIPLFKERKHYYVIAGASGKVTVQRLNWKLKSTGRSWWKEERLVATMPKSSFDKFQFFTLQDAPCSGCSETIFTKDTIIRVIPQYYPDVFLMENMQVNIGLFGRKIKLRVPKEYVNLDENYFLGTDPTGSVINYPIEWTDKNGRKKEDYYFSTIRTPLLLPFYIKKMGYTTICLNDYSYMNYRTPPFFCGFKGVGGLSLATSLQAGAFYHNDSLTSYLTAGFYFKGLNLSAGINQHAGLYSSLVYNRSFLSIPYSALSFKNHWRSLSEMPKKYKFIHLYAGADVRTSFNKKYQSFLETNIHLGTNLLNSYFRKADIAFFIQGGYAYDFLRVINKKPYPYVELGLRFDFIWF
ncbi:MAG: OmpA family protein [Crocinitomicaceae bacterium]|nr:OmpA family protein [Crocinitomicaceae bacterium]MBK8927293.1 OmpA family protein [Crocinitomicaceae bacterium]